MGMGLMMYVVGGIAVAVVLGLVLFLAMSGKKKQ